MRSKPAFLPGHVATVVLAGLFVFLASEPVVSKTPPKNSKQDKKKEEDKSKDSGPKPIARPTEPPRVPDPSELEVDVVNGRVQFGFNGQPWPDVLQWLANASELSLDWQEVPAGYLNLTTQRSYTLVEARDLINRHLQARGFVMLLSGEVLSVVKIDKLDPSSVPRVSEDELYDLQPHDFVKVTFGLPTGMDVKKASEDVEQLLRKSPRVMPLAATKRLLIIDSVANLRLVSALLNDERIEQEGREIPRRFVLRYARAERVINTLYVVLGLDPASRPSQQELQLQQKKLDLLKQMQQRGKDVAKLLNKDGPQVYLAYNRNDNSLLVNAPPEQLKVIERTIKMLDIPPPGMAERVGANPAPRFAKTYQLETIEPDSLISSLHGIGNLDPLTDLRGDKKSKVLFARASQLDHERIMKIIQQLDGPKFRVEVYWLRRHPADEVAGTLRGLVGGQREKEGKNSRRSYYDWYDWDDWDDDEEEETVELRVEADIDNNRLFIRGNDQLIEEVEAFLTQIGELEDKSGNGSHLVKQPVRVFDAMDAKATNQLLEQLRKSWPAVGGGTDLQIEDNRKPAETGAEEEGDSPKKSAGSGIRTTEKVTAGPFRFAADTTKPQSKSTGPSASVTVTEDGRIVVASDDPELLARLEKLVSALTPAETTFTEFKLDHVAAWYVHGKLEDFYEEILNAGVKNRYNLWGEYAGTEQKQATSMLSRRSKMRMIYNSVTNSIVVTNAAPAQLKEIERLIEVWDQPPLDEVILQRRTGMVKVRYSRASTIAAALKDVYRDLLSTRDKEFDTEKDKGGGFATEKLTQIEYSGAEASHYGVSTPTQKTKAIETKFSGALSIGVDELANMLVISADSELYASVVDMIQKLDDQARPKTTVQVVRVGVPAGPLREALDDALDRPWPGGKPESQATRRRGNSNRQNEQNNQQRRPRSSSERRGR